MVGSMIFQVESVQGQAATVVYEKSCFSIVLCILFDWRMWISNIKCVLSPRVIAHFTISISHKLGRRRRKLLPPILYKN